MVNEVIDISLPIKNGMWAYRNEWRNSVTEIESVLKGGKSTVYHLNLHSHTGTYIETCEHKLPVEKKFEAYGLNAFCGQTKVVRVEIAENNSIPLSGFLASVKSSSLEIMNGDKLIIFSGYGKNHDRSDYLELSPWFDDALTAWLIDKKLSLLGVDSPIIENQQSPYQPVTKLFEANNDMLLLAPLLMDANKIFSGNYTLSAFPLPISGISGCLCRALLFK